MFTERLSLSVPPVASSVAVVRAFAEQRLAALRRADLVEDGVLIASELVSNAVQALERSGRQIPIAVRIVLDADRPQLRVWDAAEEPPVVCRSADPLAEHGRGLLLVEALSHCFTWRWERVGKTVLATL